MQRWIRTISLFLLAAVVTLRPLVAETYDSAQDPLSAALGGLADPSPVRTFVFDLLILAGAAGWSLSFALDAEPTYRRTGLAWGAGCILLAVVVSCLAAGNQRLAMNASIDWLCYPILAIALTQLTHRPWHRRVILAAILASACVQAAQCADQYFVGMDEAWEHYQREKAALWARQGVDLDSARVALYERRILSREASGFMPHSNIAASYLVLCGFTAAGLVTARWRAVARQLRTRRASGHPAPRGDEMPQPQHYPIRLITASGTTLAAALIAFAVPLTKSLGAMLSAVAGAVMGILLILFRESISRHRTRVYVAGWLFVFAAGVGTLGYGLVENRLPGSSLTFRWQYWKASAQLIADHALTGVGRENFGRHYLQYKDIQSPEEVANPHDFIIQAGAAWGLLGIIGLLAMLFGASRHICLTRRAHHPVERASDGPDAPPRTLPMIAAWSFPLLFIVVVGRLPLLGTSDPNYLYYVSMTTGMIWFLGFTAFGAGAGRPREVAESEAIVWISVALGLFTFLLHDVISFAMFVPATATTFFALLGVCLAERSDDLRQLGRSTTLRRWLPFGVVVVAVVVISTVGLLPVARATYYLRRARHTGQQVLPVPIRSQLADHYFRMAAQADPLDPTPWVERAQWLMHAAQVPQLRRDALRFADESLSQAITRDPFSVRLRRMHMQLYRRKAQLTGRLADYRAAIVAAEKVHDLYPSDPKALADLASCQLDAGEATGDEALLRQSIASYRAALALDERRPSWETLRRLRAKERQAIEGGMARAERLLQRQP